MAFEFVLSDAAGRPPQSSRKTIRSHVMRGKNRTKRVHLRSDPFINLELSHLSSEGANPSVAGNCEHKATREGPSPPAKQSRASSHTSSSNDSSRSVASSASRGSNTVNNVLGRHGLESESPADEKRAVCLKQGPRASSPDTWAPFPVGKSGDLGLFTFADKTNSESHRLIFLFFTCFQTEMYPAERSFHVAELKSDWFKWLFTNPTFLHTSIFAFGVMEETLLTSRSRDPLFIDEITTSTMSRRSYSRLSQALQFLRADMVRRDRQGLESTVAVIVALSSVALATGDVATFKAHYMALQSLVALRGGPAILNQLPQLAFKFLRIDLAWYCKTGCRPAFITEDPSWGSWFDAHPSLGAGQPEGQSDAGLVEDISPEMRWILGNLDGSLSHVFRDTRHFASLVNAYMDSSQKLDFHFFIGILQSVSYRLVLLRYPLEPRQLSSASENGCGEPLSLNEPFRLGLLTLLASVFLLTPWYKQRHDYLGERLRQCIETIDTALPLGGGGGGGEFAADPSQVHSGSARADLKLWMLFMGAVTVFDVREPWLLDGIGELIGPLASWEDVRRRLQGAIWVERLHEALGKRVFDMARESGRPSAAVGVKLVTLAQPGVRVRSR